jgi:hypothetical protein
VNDHQVVKCPPDRVDGVDVNDEGPEMKPVIETEVADAHGSKLRRRDRAPWVPARTE